MKIDGIIPHNSNITKMKKRHFSLLTALYLACQSPAPSVDITLPTAEPWRQKPTSEEETEMQEMFNRAGSFAWYKEEATKLALQQKDIPQKDIREYLAVNDFKGLIYQRDKILGSAWLNKPRILEAIVYVESSGNANIGCNAKGACGPAQVKKNGYVEVVRLLFGDHDEAREFRQKHGSKLTQLTNLLDAISSGKFGEMRNYSVQLRELRRVLTGLIKEKEAEVISLENACGKTSWQGNCSEQYDALQDELKSYQLNNSQAFSLYILLQNGLNPTYAPAREDYQKRSRLLASSTVDALMAQLTDRKEEWAETFDVQDEIARGWEETKNNPWFNLLIADTHLAYYTDYFGDEALGLEAYNSGIKAVKERLKEEKKKVAKGSYQLDVSNKKESFGQRNVEVYGERGGQDLNCNHEFNPCFGEWFSEKK